MFNISKSVKNLSIDKKQIRISWGLNRFVANFAKLEALYLKYSYLIMDQKAEIQTLFSIWI